MLTPTEDHSSVIPRDAATVVVARDHERGAGDGGGGSGLDVFMVKRHGGNKFMANAWVFPGGKRDDDDGHPSLASRCDRDGLACARLLGMSDEIRARGLLVAALRETFEEAGLLLGEAAVGLARLRDSLNGEAWPSQGESGVKPPGARRGEPLSELAQRHDLRLHLSELLYIAHWVTPPFERRRFDTRFFFARAPAGQAAAHDQRETSDGRWFAVDELLQRHREDEVALAPPTLHTLLRLAPFRSVDAVWAGIQHGTVSTISPQLLKGAADLTLLLPGDEAFSPAGPTGQRCRVLRVGEHWQFVNESESCGRG